MVAGGRAVSGELDIGIKNVEFVFKEDDGCCWVESSKLYINLRWCEPSDNALIEYIIRCAVHEVVEHVLGEGHQVAEKAEKILFEKV